MAAGHPGGVGNKEVWRQGDPLVDAGNAAADARRYDETVPTDAGQYQERHLTSARQSRRLRSATGLLIC